MITEEEAEFLRMEEELKSHAFVYVGCGEWHDAVTSLKHPTVAAYKILKQRMEETKKHEKKYDPVVLLEVVRLLSRATSLSCVQPIEYDYHEYEACKKCSACIARFTIERLQKEGKLPKGI